MESTPACNGLGMPKSSLMPLRRDLFAPIDRLSGPGMAATRTASGPFGQPGGPPTAWKRSEQQVKIHEFSACPISKGLEELILQRGLALDEEGLCACDKDHVAGALPYPGRLTPDAAPAPRSLLSRYHVTGPSFTLATSIMAPNTPSRTRSGL